MSRKKVLLVTGVFPPGIGGMQNYYYHLAKNSKLDMTVLASSYDGDEQFDKAQSFRILRGNFLRNESLHMSSWLRMFRLVRQTIREERIEITIYGHVLIAFIGYLLSCYGKRRYIISTHGMDMLMFRRFRILNRLVGRILRRADGVLTNSQFTRSLVEEYGVEPARIELIYPGVDQDYNQEPENPALKQKYSIEGRYNILSVGRLVERKGYDRVIEALHELVKVIPNVMYIIAGDGPERKRLQQLASDEGVSDYVTFLGAIESKHALNSIYNLCDQFIMVCRQLESGDAEGFGIVYLEAASTGLPVIAGKSGGASEAVLHEETGLLVDPSSKQELVEAILRFKQNDMLRARLTKNGYERAKSSFNYVALADKLDRFLSQFPASKRSLLPFRSREMLTSKKSRAQAK
ncbi:glycosyltransferase family 4 protein [Paenibacillus sp. HB172176]|uniref:glycosyltransferase family 4 protein n=1 Tax=Paenibacillus sp. HB172176 TaxID=2493690 RepID=UPI00143930E8|nr:glycosyltransferase family 4 protein [Paenibacillus sp. HB172176]